MDCLAREENWFWLSDLRELYQKGLQENKQDTIARDLLLHDRLLFLSNRWDR